VKVLVLGSGAREHALVRALAIDPSVTSIAAAPGNPGMGVPCLPADAADPAAVAALAVDYDLVVVGPELPLVNGVADAVRQAGVACFGPSAEAARLEGSKAFAKEVMAAAGVPTAMAHVCTTLDEVGDALDAFGPPHVVKDDGLAAGKGVVVTDARDEALAHAAVCLDKPGGQVVIEEFLDGPEVSLFVICDGTSAVPLAPAQDFKRVGDGDSGPNTGGMGAYSPLPWAPPHLVADVMDRVAVPVVREMARRGTPFAGVLYCGLALTARGMRVVEFNVRFGDPETQSVLARLATPLGGLLRAAATGDLAGFPPLRWHDAAAVTVVLAAENYPSAPHTGGVITGLDDAGSVPGAVVLHAGTALDDAGRLVSAGGRVLSVVGMAPDLEGARTAAYRAISRIGLTGSHYRTDIAAAASRAAG
jgi:phosphoribosylamine--glycine ligase